MDAIDPTDKRLETAIALLREMLSQNAPALSPWQERDIAVPPISGRLSATDRLSWWFRPMTSSRDPWDDYFDPAALNPIETFSPGVRSSGSPFITEQPSLGPPGIPPNAAELPGPWVTLRLLLAEPEEELLEEEGEAVVTCLYDFLHAIGRREVEQAMTCVAPDYHTLEDDEEIDYLGLTHQLLALLDSLQGWEIEVSLVEIPQPILHPDGILIYAEIQIDAVKPEEGTRKSIPDRRLAVFTRQPNGDWLISALSPL
jgi:hypothetical protein